MSKRSSVRAFARVVALVLPMTGGGAAIGGTIAGSDHDFSTSGWAGGQICVPCHTPHKAITTVTGAPLWNHALSTVTSYTLYSSPTLNATVAQPGTSSKLCLSCHDGTVALNSFGGTTGSTFMSGGAKIGNAAQGATSSSLAAEHPIGFDYTTALATADGSLKDPATANVTIGSGTQTRTGTIASTILFGGKMECSSCHDVHKMEGSAPGSGILLRISGYDADGRGSLICRTCHIK